MALTLPVDNLLLKRELGAVHKMRLFPHRMDCSIRRFPLPSPKRNVIVGLDPAICWTYYLERKHT